MDKITRAQLVTLGGAAGGGASSERSAQRNRGCLHNRGYSVLQCVELRWLIKGLRALREIDGGLFLSPTMPDLIGAPLDLQDRGMDGLACVPGHTNQTFARSTHQWCPNGEAETNLLKDEGPSDRQHARPGPHRAVDAQTDVALAAHRRFVQCLRGLSDASVR